MGVSWDGWTDECMIRARMAGPIQWNVVMMDEDGDEGQVMMMMMMMMKMKMKKMMMMMMMDDGWRIMVVVVTLGEKMDVQ